MPIRRSRLAFAAVAMIAATAAHAQAKSTPDQLVQALPVEVPEVISGGGWQANGLAGVYRGVVVISGEGASSAARVYVQWIGLKADGSAPQIVKSIAVPELASLNLPNAQLSLDAEKDNEATLVVTSFDIKTQKPQFFAFKAGLPGDIKSAPVPPELARKP